MGMVVATPYSRSMSGSTTSKGFRSGSATLRRVAGGRQNHPHDSSLVWLTKGDKGTKLVLIHKSGTIYDTNWNQGEKK
jgi:hypothetical protein